VLYSNSIAGTLKWINPDGYEVEDNPSSPVFITREDRSQKTGIRLFFINVTKKDAGEYKCQFVKVRQNFYLIHLSLE